MPVQLVRSIKTLKNFVRPEDIHVFYTPPYDEGDERMVRDLGVNLWKADAETDSFAPLPGKSPGYYGEKTKVGLVDAENVVFLDCDTLVLDDPFQVLEGDFDVKARPDQDTEYGNLEEFFRRNGKPVMGWIPNAGFIVFKNGVHKPLAEDWNRFLDADFGYAQHGYNKDQFALALAMSEYKVEKMSGREHVMEFHEGSRSDGIVYHTLTQNSTVHQVSMSLLRNLPFGSKLRYGWWRLQSLKEGVMEK